MAGEDRADEQVKRTDTKAVALSYEPQGFNAPEVVAKGTGELAERIIAVALANDINVREDADLVELLDALEIGDEIPMEAFAAVAEVLTYVYRKSGKTPPGVTEALDVFEDDHGRKRDNEYT
ncbi:MAG: EscU/YscU/HrcU family type III secretion system export apparatus switch protein [Rhodospirillales bacterium]|nr:EscU/YscU/HrcU family type III secretion system export apparatus switch protein [Rhodospirillales bacterium]MCW8861058.1 EscU/YscU/HrcU family type III secretion system export apparatus switch protein [Rhodospirillales bacterium]MCW8953054.1 EscU/YscU/HrcU family type III secretion system export apparatus switch protein [Rhodospirillales bacterium]MCW8970698.1 EscU/YscU/HrcU family type III secretion system export apparatus switch protein [Rhodospirillales bacterium]MCW9003481.1 EscU/YscU/Hr